MSRKQTGRAPAALPWYEALALWKAAVFCEEIYGRFLRGEGVPALLAAGAACSARA